MIDTKALAGQAVAGGRERMDQRMRRVIIESPYTGDVERNLRYLRALRP